jgi:hypothetical protein
MHVWQEEKASSKEVVLSDLPAAIHSWLKRNPHFQLSMVSGNSVTSQIQHKISRRGLEKQASYPNLVKGGAKGRAKIVANHRKKSEGWFVGKSGTLKPMVEKRVGNKGGSPRYYHIALNLEKSTYTKQVKDGIR